MRIAHERVCYRKSMSFAYFKDRIDLVLKNVENYSKESCIKDILELKNIELYIKSINSNNEFTKNDKNNYSRYISLICKSINLYFSQINGDNFESFISQITFDEVYDFWDIITSYKMIHKISQDNFESYLNNNPEHIKILVQFKEITLKYGELLYKCFCNNPHLISYIISYLFEKNNSNKTTTR